MKKLLVITLPLMAALVLSACQPKKDGVRGTVSAAPAASNLVGSFGVATACPQGTQQTEGVISETSAVQYIAGDATGSFEDRVKAFLSASVSPNDIGTLIQNGVRFVGVLKLDTSGNVVGAQSKLTIGVYDSIWYNNRIYNPSEPPITLTFDPAKSHSISGQFSPSTGVGFLVVKDSFGEIRFEGTIDAQNFSGTVRYQNTKSVVGSPTKGPLGNFSIPRCAIVQ